VELPKVGDRVAAGAAMGWGDSYRRAFDLIAPVSGEVIEVNAEFQRDPSRLNAYPYVRNGLLKVRVDQLRAYEALMSFADYAEHVHRVSRYDEWTRERRMT
jgi:glycine cleavage system H protein